MKTIKVRRTSHDGPCWRSKYELISNILLWIPSHRLAKKRDGQQEAIYNCSVPIQDIALKTSRKGWTIEMVGKRGPERSMLAVRHDEIYISHHVDDYTHTRIYECAYTHEDIYTYI